MHVWLSSCFGSRTEVQANSAYACPSFRRTASDVFIQVRMIWLEGGNPRPTSKPTQSHGSRAPEHTGGIQRPTSGPAQRVGIVPSTDVPIGRRRMCSPLGVGTQQSETEQGRNTMAGSDRSRSRAGGPRCATKQPDSDGFANHVAAKALQRVFKASVATAAKNGSPTPTLRSSVLRALQLNVVE